MKLEDLHNKAEGLGEVEQLKVVILELGQIAEERGVEVEELKEALEEAIEQARKDSLTGILNRGGFEMEVERRKQSKTSIIFIDVDDFKSINDTYGHDVGDRVLQIIARVIDKVARAGDELVRLPEAITGRIGGDEFAIALPGADEKGAEEALRKIVKAVEYTPIEVEREVDGEIIKEVIFMKISGGVGESMGGADEEMYEEKKRRREEENAPE
ncbi:GGDEF domain-containing protein [Patescibacteria group bacterium]|nr:GGDEF domain-containing protein [Patescibacteria group bacterium]